MRTIYLVRHGKREQPEGVKLAIGRTDLSLSEEGRETAEKLALDLLEDLNGEAVEKIYTSPSARCLASAELLQKGLGNRSALADGKQVPIEIVEDLREIDLGHWEGLRFDEIKRRYPEEFEARGRDMADFRIPGGESFRQVQNRALKVYDRIQKRTSGHVIVVTHAGVIRTLVSAFEQRDLKDLMEIPVPHSSFYKRIDHTCYMSEADLPVPTMAGVRQKSFSAMILAAGLSSRMGDYKPLMKLEGETVWEKILKGLFAGGVEEIAVVSGYRAEDLKAETERVIRENGLSIEIAWLYNEHFAETGMWDSAKIGFEYYKDKAADGIFITLADVPLFDSETMQKEKILLEDGDIDVIIPCFHGKGGHPVLVRSAGIGRILTHRGERGLKGAYELLPGKIVRFEAGDKGASMDADTPEQFEKLKSFLEGKNEIN